MNVNSKRVKALFKLGLHLKKFTKENSEYSDLQKSVEKAKTHNRWFTQKNIEEVFSSWGSILNPNHIEKWLEKYNLKHIEKPKTIALILAGNIPMVGFHDIICVWISGHNAQIKCASKDESLLPYVTGFLENETGDSAFVYTNHPFTFFDAVIATGSNNSARYFNHYFGKYPHIIRKNRNGVAVLNGGESKDQLENLGNDILQYFGLGCRNVSKVYLPNKYNLNSIFGGLYPHSKVIENAKYANNYDYNKAVFLMSEYVFLENGFFMIRQSKEFSAPIACLHYEYYSNKQDLKKHLKENREAIQCVVSNMQLEGEIDFGNAQKPNLWDYADGIDTLLFINNLN